MRKTDRKKKKKKKFFSYYVLVERSRMETYTAGHCPDITSAATLIETRTKRSTHVR